MKLSESDMLKDLQVLPPELRSGSRKETPAQCLSRSLLHALPTSTRLSFWCNLRLSEVTAEKGRFGAVLTHCCRHHFQVSTHLLAVSWRLDSCCDTLLLKRQKPPPPFTCTALVKPKPAAGTKKARASRSSHAGSIEGNTSCHLHVTTNRQRHLDLRMTLGEPLPSPAEFATPTSAPSTSSDPSKHRLPCTVLRLQFLDLCLNRLDLRRHDFA